MFRQDLEGKGRGLVPRDVDRDDSAKERMGVAAEAGLKLGAVKLGRQQGGAVVAGLGDRGCSHDP